MKKLIIIILLVCISTTSWGFEEMWFSNGLHHVDMETDFPEDTCVIDYYKDNDADDEEMYIELFSEKLTGRTVIRKTIEITEFGEISGYDNMILFYTRVAARVFIEAPILYLVIRPGQRVVAKISHTNDAIKTRIQFPRCSEEMTRLYNSRLDELLANSPGDHLDNE